MSRMARVTQMRAAMKTKVVMRAATKTKVVMKAPTSTQALRIGLKTHGDLLNKARGLIRKICSSGQRFEHFTNVIKGGNQYGWWKDAQGSAMTIEPKQL